MISLHDFPPGLLSVVQATFELQWFSCRQVSHQRSSVPIVRALVSSAIVLPLWCLFWQTRWNSSSNVWLCRPMPCQRVACLELLDARLLLILLLLLLRSSPSLWSLRFFTPAPFWKFWTSTSINLVYINILYIFHVSIWYFQWCLTLILYYF